MVVVCGVCETEFEAKRASAKYCGDRCRQLAKRKRDAASADEVEQADASTKGTDGSGRKSDLAAAVRKQLVDAERLDTVAGQLALELAAQVTAAGATGIAGLSKELRTVMDEALAGAKPKGPVIKDQVAEARKKRDAKKARQATR